MRLKNAPAEKVNLSLNALRAIAAFLVVIGHARALFFVDFGDADSKSVFSMLFYAVTSLGHQAVIVFFVLSGYWVGGAAIRSASKGTFSWSTYFISRLTRLWIVLIPALVLTQLLDRLGSSLNGQSSIYSGADAYHTVVPVGGPLQHLGLFDTIGNLFFVQSIYVPALGTNSPLWSLAYEFWYYVLFPAVLLIFARHSAPRFRAIAALIALVAVTVAGPGVLALFPVWLAGAVVAWQRGRIENFLAELSFVKQNGFRVLALVLLIASCVLSNMLKGPSYLMDYAVALGAVLFVGAYTKDPSSARAVEPLSRAAEWSYTLYAIHVPIVAFVASLVVPFADQRWQFSTLTLGKAAIVLATVAFLCWCLSLITEARTARVRRGTLRLVSLRKASLEMGDAPGSLSSK